ncbi:MAG TPA: outer membrane beta-barrel protein [Xanthobacteraceae bacterium]|nr:outer membrane beta-barrel protein [Xanthobacteraceae bacterium]
MRGHHFKSQLMCGVAAGALACVLGASGTAQAQYYDWTGFYVGAYVGGAWGSSNAVSGTDCPSRPIIGGKFLGGYFCESPTNPLTAATVANAAAVGAAGTGSMSSSAFIGGAQAGYNWQSGRAVYGVEADFGSFSLNESRQGSGAYPVMSPFAFQVIPTAPRFAVSSSLSTDWLVTVRGRIGWTVDNWLFFATGGLALTNVESTVNFSDNVASNGGAGAFGAGSNAATKVGWTIGAGAQYAIDKHWSVKAEYLFVDFNAIDTTALVTPPPNLKSSYANLIDTSQDLKAHVARVGVNYRF